MGLTILCRIFLTFSRNVGIFCKILSVPHKIVMDLNDVMLTPSGFAFVHLRYIL